MIGEALLGAVFQTIIEHTIKPARNVLAKWRRKPAANWVARLNDHFRGRVVIFGEPMRSEPRIRILGRYELDSARQEAARQQRLALINEQKRNDPHAILVNRPRWDVDPVYLEAKTLFYNEVRALRDNGLGDLKPEVLSANAVFFCDETQELILHERSFKSDTWAKPEGDEMPYLHTLGGAYQPPDMDGTPGDKLSLLHTARREVFEEAEAQLIWEEDPPMIMLKELETGFIQLALLGINITPRAAKRLEGNWEGRVIRVPFSELERKLTSEEPWVPTGKAHVLAWLALCSPNSRPRVRFGKLKPVELFNRIVK